MIWSEVPRIVWRNSTPEYMQEDGIQTPSLQLETGESKNCLNKPTESLQADSKLY